MGIADWWRSLFSPRAKNPGVNDPFSVGFLPAGNASRRQRRGVEQILTAYEMSPRLRSVVDRIARSVAATNWRVYRAKSSSMARRARSVLAASDRLNRDRIVRNLIETEGLTEVEAHPVIDLLSRNSADFTAFETRELVQKYLELVGEGFLWKRKGVKTGAVVELIPVPPSWVRKTPDEKEQVFDVQGQIKQKIPADEMYWIKEPSPGNPWGRGSGIGLTLSDELDVDERAQQTALYKYENRGIPDLIVKAPDQDVEVIEEKWMAKQRGHRNIGKVHFSNNPQLEVEQLGGDIVDLGLVEQRDSIAAIIRETWGVPPEILGVIENSNRATIQAADFLFALLILDPRLRKWQDFINSRVVPDFGGDVVVAYDNVIPDDWEFIAGIVGAHAWAFSANEIRALAHHKDVDNGDLHNLANAQLGKIEEREMAEPPTVQPPSPSEEEQDPMGNKEEMEAAIAARIEKRVVDRLLFPSGGPTAQG